MKVYSYACDECGERSERGWLVVDGAVSMTKGRDSKRAAQTTFLDNRLRHFCSFACFEAKLRNHEENKND